MQRKIINSIFLFLFLSTIPVLAKEYTLLSPDGKLKLTVHVDEQISIQIQNEGRIVIENSPIDMLINGQSIGKDAKVKGQKKRTVNNVLTPVLKIKTDRVNEHYNELSLAFRKDFSLILRAYNEGVAYRFETTGKGNQIISNEMLEINLPTASRGYLMQEKDFGSMSESPYICNPINEYNTGDLFSVPGLFQTDKGDFVLITESDLYDYPGMWITKTEDAFKSVFPGKVTQTENKTCLSERFVTERADYIAVTQGNRKFPWRIFAVASHESQLITNQLVYLLATPEVKGDYSWIESGLATLDWWGRRNIYGTDFKGGVNTETHKYFVDFNSKYGLKYFVLDDGWSDACDLKKVNPALDLDELKVYAEQKGVKLVFWVHAFALKQDIPGYLDFMKSKGAAGIKVDFIARDDQDGINLFHEIAQEALKREMVIDFHGVCKPFGLHRTYPNVLTSEGLIEFEMNGVTDWANPLHHTLLPFIRMVTGPMDYLPGTFNNAQKREFSLQVNRPVGLGTRSHSMALAVLYESPLTMLPDSPSDYLQEDECTIFMGTIPMEWDETKVLDSKIGEYVVIARRSGKEWFVSAITNWDARELNVSLDFLDKGSYQVECFMDGPNSATRAIDYKKKVFTITENSSIPMSLTTGGGWIGRITKK